MRKTKIVTDFLSRQLHSSRRFAPGYSDTDEDFTTVAEPETAPRSTEKENAPPVPEPEPANAPNPDLENTLAAAETEKAKALPTAEPEDEPAPEPEPEPNEDFTAVAEPETAPRSTEKENAPPMPEPAPQQNPDLNSILAKESNATYDTAKRRELAELQRHRREVMQHLHELRTNIEQEKEALEAKIHFFASLQDELQNFSDQTGENSIRELRQAVNNAHMECLKAEKQRHNENRNEAIKDPSASIMALTSLSFSQLTKIGSGLLWPLLAALLAAGGIIAVTIYAIFAL